MAGDHLAANLELIDGKNKPLADQIRSMPVVNHRLAENAKGDLVGQCWDVATQKWVPLCNNEDPWGEARNDADQLYSPDTKIFCLMGLGLGYFAAEFASRLRPYQRMAVFDVSPSGYKAALHAVDMAPLLGNRRVDTFIGDRLDVSMRGWWMGLQSHEKFHIGQPMRAGYTGHAQAQEYDGLLMLCVDMMRYHQVGLATWKQFGVNIGENDLGNLPEYLITPGLNSLAGIWKDKPAVCLAAGPSLRKNVMQLTDPYFRSRVAVLSVGTVYALINAIGLEPDIVTTIDFQRLNYTDQFENVPLDPETALVYLHSTYPETIRRWPGPKFVSLNSSDTVEWMKRFTEEKSSAAQVQTVAHLNVVAALLMGANPIILLGQDLAMPIDEHHTPGARVQDTSPEDNLPAHVNADDIHGKPCHTRHSFLSMRTVFQEMFQKHPETTFYNCSEEGINIVGATNAKLADVLQQHVVGQDESEPLKPVLKKIYQGYTPSSKWEEFFQESYELITQIESLEALATRMIDLKGQWEGAVGREDEVAKAGIEAAVLAEENVIKNYPIAFGMFAVRSFPIVEVLSQVPPPDGTSNDDERILNFHRLVGIATEMLQHVKPILECLHDCRNRVADLAPDGTQDKTIEGLRTMMGRQSIEAVQRLIDHGLTNGAMVPTDASIQETVTLFGTLHEKRNEYAAAIALLKTWKLGASTIQLCQMRIDDHEDQMRPLRPVYYASLVAHDDAPTIVLASSIIASAINLEPIEVKAETVGGDEGTT